MENIFKNAKFGDKFVTRDGRIAIYQKSFGTDMHCLMLEEDDGLVDYFSNGNVVYEFSANEERKEQDDDIISRYKEPIDEDELDEFACQSSMFLENGSVKSKIRVMNYELGFKVGYRKAKEE